MANKQMKKLYHWQGKDPSGEVMSGEILAHSLVAAKAYLRSEKIIALKIKVKPKLNFSKRNRIKTKDITIFTRQLATMLSSGIPLVQAFGIVAKSHPNQRMKKLIVQIKKSVEEGHSFSDTLKKHPTLFNGLFCNLIYTGEQTGALDQLLDRLATYKEKTDSLKSKIKKALVYPATIVSVALVITSIILVFVVPQFQELFQGFGAELPYLTRQVITLSEFLQSYWWALLFSLSILTYGFSFAYKKKSKLRHFIEHQALKLPLLGNLLSKAAVARFSRTLATTFSAGVPIIEGLESVAYASGNIVFEKASLQIRYELSKGKQLHEAIQFTQKFSEIVTQMVAIGEESGELEHMLNKVADYYEEEVDNTVDTISTLIEPLLMVMLGILIGGLIIAMYLPIFKMGSIV